MIVLGLQQVDKAEQRQKKRRDNAERKRHSNLVIDKTDAMQVPSKVCSFSSGAYAH